MNKKENKISEMPRPVFISGEMDHLISHPLWELKSKINAEPKGLIPIYNITLSGDIENLKPISWDESNKNNSPVHG